MYASTRFAQDAIRAKQKEKAQRRALRKAIKDLKIDIYRYREFPDQIKTLEKSFRRHDIMRAMNYMRNKANYGKGKLAAANGRVPQVKNEVDELANSDDCGDGPSQEVEKAIKPPKAQPSRRLGALDVKHKTQSVQQVIYDSFMLDNYGKMHLYTSLSIGQFHILHEAAMNQGELTEAAIKSVPDMPDRDKSIGICLITALTFLKHGGSMVHATSACHSPPLGGPRIIRAGIILIQTILRIPATDAETMTEDQLVAAIMRNAQRFPMITQKKTTKKTGASALQGCIGYASTFIIDYEPIPGVSSGKAKKVVVVADGRFKILSKAIDERNVANYELLMKTPIFEKHLGHDDTASERIAPWTVQCKYDQCKKDLKTFVVADASFIHEDASNEPHLFIADQELFKTDRLGAPHRRLIEEYKVLRKLEKNDAAIVEDILDASVLLYNARHGHFLNGGQCPSDGSDCFECDTDVDGESLECVSYQDQQSMEMSNRHDPTSCFVGHSWSRSRTNLPSDNVEPPAVEYAVQEILLRELEDIGQEYDIE